MLPLSREFICVTILLMRFYSEMGEGGQMKYLPNHHGIQSRLMDGTDVTFRPYPKSIGSPAVEVRIRFESLIHKIHFLQRREHDKFDNRKK